MDKVNKALEDLRIARNEQRVERQRKAQKEQENHMKQMAEKYDVVGNPKFDLCYSRAWDYGHSAGFSEVEIYFSELVELIK